MCMPKHILTGSSLKLAVVTQGLPDAQTPENVLTLIDDLQTQLLRSAEHLGQVETQCAEQAGGCFAEAQPSRSAADQHCNHEHRSLDTQVYHTETA